MGFYVETKVSSTLNFIWINFFLNFIDVILICIILWKNYMNKHFITITHYWGWDKFSLVRFFAFVKYLATVIYACLLIMHDYELGMIVYICYNMLTWNVLMEMFFFIYDIYKIVFLYDYYAKRLMNVFLKMCYTI